MERLKIPVDEFTSPTPITVGPEHSAADVAEVLKENGIRHIPVVEGEIPVGIISERDLRVLSSVKELNLVTASEIMVPDPFTVTPETPLDQVVYEMSDRKIGSAIVQDADGKIVGIFTNTDALNALIEILRGVVPN
ncbi:MAG: CBS domain-containing protein [Bdellovibrionaceae bacterium]|nr:CBS domain-containing protein [Bdellovibrionales bacterium]MCB9084118.1 CBS domain-containing protein [Pseudobdellovibrionaceae bacterium]